METTELTLDEIRKHKYSLRFDISINLIKNIQCYWPDAIVLCKKYNEIDNSDKIYFKNFTGLYLFIDKDYNVLYVGKTKNFYNRLQQHEKDFEQKKEDFQVIKNTLYLILITSDLEDLDDNEVSLIVYLKPLHNRLKFEKYYKYQASGCLHVPITYFSDKLSRALRKEFAQETD